MSVVLMCALNYRQHLEHRHHDDGVLRAREDERVFLRTDLDQAKNRLQSLVTKSQGTSLKNTEKRIKDEDTVRRATIEQKIEADEVLNIEARILELDGEIEKINQKIHISENELKEDVERVAEMLFPELAVAVVGHHGMGGGGMRRKRTLRRGSVKKNTRRERRGSIQNRRWYNRDRDLLKKKKRDTRRRRSRKTKTIKVARCR
jgi:hypothetical protein